VAGFKNGEKAAVGFRKSSLPPRRRKQNGGNDSRRDNWASYAIQDGLLIGGQNWRLLSKGTAS